MKKKKIYLATSLDKDKLNDMRDAFDVLGNKGYDVYVPKEHTIHSAWDYPNNEWGLMVFQNDVEAIKNCDIVVALSYGRDYTSSGVDWEIGFAFGIKKPVILVEMTNNDMSLMVANGRYATVKGIEGLKEYDFENLPVSRTNTWQT